MSKKLLSIVALVIVLTILAACATPASAPPAPAPQLRRLLLARLQPQPRRVATSAPAPATEPAAAGDVCKCQGRSDEPFPERHRHCRVRGCHPRGSHPNGPQIASPMENLWKDWSAKTGGTVEVQTFPFGDLFEKIRAGYVSGASPFDIIVYASDWAGDIMGAGYVLEVPQKNQDAMGYKYLIPTYRDRILSWGGKVYGTPYDGDAHNTYLRKDLLTDPKNMADFKAKYRL